MFANNEKISQRQLTRLLALDWIGKLCLLLPILLKPINGWAGVAALLLGALWAFFYASAVGSLAKGIPGRFTDSVRERLGRVCAVAVALLFFLYLCLNQVYLARAVGEVCRVFLLPEHSELVIGFLFLLAGWAAASGSVQKRARVAEVLFPVAAVMLVIMLAASAGSVRWENLSESAGAVSGGTLYDILCQSACTFAAFSGLGVTLYQVPCFHRKNRMGAAIKRAVLLTGGFLVVLFLIMLGAFGAADLDRLEWPVLVLMSNVNIPGGFLQRWDVIFLSVLLLSLLVASGTGIFYMGRILGELFPRVEESGLQVYCVGICALVMVLVGSYETAERLFVRWAICAVMPLLILFPILLWVIEKVKKCRKRKS